MEHSLLHGLQLLGLIVAGGSFWFSLLAWLAGIFRESPDVERLARLWGRRASWAAGLATFGDIFVQVAEVDGRTVFGGVDPALVAAFVQSTVVGQLGCARGAVLLVLGLALSIPGRVGWIAALPCYAAAAVLTASVSHAAAQPVGAGVAVGLHLLHLVVLSAWIGVVFHLWLTRKQWSVSTRAAAASAWVALLGRFSPLALVTAAVATVSGFVAALRFVPSAWDLCFSAYGLSLSLKLVLVAAIAVAGAYNFLVAVPNLRRAALPFSAENWLLASQRFQRSLELEATAGLLAIVLAGIVASVSPPGADGSVTLTRDQVASLLTPKLPARSFVDPALFVGEWERNRFDLMYSEFMHNWSGVGVIVIGCLWLLHAFGGWSRAVATKLWPFVLLPFALFISVFADPEVFVLRQVTFREAVADPVVLEHQIGALLVLVLVWLGWRDRRRPVSQQPLGPALPILMIVGSVLLLGHAHNSVRSTAELTNLINVQHAVFGSFGLLAGTIRWFSLRGILPAPVARFTWPVLIILLGLFMAFFYEEAV